MNLKKSLLSLMMILGCMSTITAAKTDTIVTTSAAMKKSIKAVVILPDSYSTDKEWPVVYLLHGYGGNYAD